MNKEDIMKYALIAGGAFAVYWYITNHGPNGAVYAADGVTKVGASYWDTWFGTAAPLPVAYQQPPTFTPVATAPGVVHTTPTPPPPSTTVAQLRAAMAKAAGINDLSLNSGYSLSADQWNYYQNQVNPPALTGQQFSQLIAALPAGVDRSMLTIDQFLSALVASGAAQGGLHGMGLGRVGDIVPVQSRPSIPMMSFGGGLGGGFNAFQQKGKWTN